MINLNGLAQTQQRYLQAGRENLSYAGEQAALLSRLSLHHSRVIARHQAEAARMVMTALQELVPKLLVPNIGDAFVAYATDCSQRWILFLETLCQRGDDCVVREQEGFRPVLAFDYDLIVDGRSLDRPVNSR
jgi:hypothetical protein